jgi:hypothetical protein
MKRVRSINKLPFLLLLFSRLVCGADLSSGADLSIYRGFQLGMSLDAAVKHSGMDMSEVTTVHQHPARIQELAWNPERFSTIFRDADPVEQVLFSFYNGELFRMVVDYDTEKTSGLTSEDIIAAVSRKYGAPTRPGLVLLLPGEFSEDTVQVVARWENPDNLFSLLQLPSGSGFRLVIVSKRLNALADNAVAEGVRLDAEAAPALLMLNEQNAKADLNKNRFANQAHFRP